MKLSNYFTVATLALALATVSGCKEEVDPCLGVLCEHDGECIDGTCICADGFTGETCEIENAPTSIAIARIVVSNVTGEWDDPLITRADVMLMVYYETTQNLLYDSESEGSIYFDVRETDILEFIPDTTVTLTDVNRPLKLLVEDWDGGGYTQQMAFWEFEPYIGGNGFPEFRTLQASGMTVSVYYEYSWQ